MVLHCPAEINIVWRGAYVDLKALYTPFSNHSAFQNMQAAHTVCTYARQKPLCAIWNVLLKLSFLSGIYIYVQLFHFNCIEKVLFVAILGKLLNLNTSMKKC